MCGRFLLDLGKNEDLARLIGPLAEEELVRVGEVFPTDMIFALVKNGQGKTVALPLKWGMDSLSGGSPHINARAETVLERPTFRAAFLENRCVIPTTGFFEWDKQKKKHLIKKKGSEVLYLAGFFKDGQVVILTTEPSETVAKIHDRMPVFLEKNEIENWLTDLSVAISHLTKPSVDLLAEKVPAEVEQLDLFEED